MVNELFKWQGRVISTSLNIEMVRLKQEKNECVATSHCLYVRVSPKCNQFFASGVTSMTRFVFLDDPFRTQLLSFGLSRYAQDRALPGMAVGRWYDCDLRRHTNF